MRTFVPRALQDSGLVNLTLYNYLWNEIKGGGCKRRVGKGKERKVIMQSPIYVASEAFSIWTNPTFSNTTYLLLLTELITSNFSLFPYNYQS